MSDGFDLGQVQRWMQAVITHPDGAGVGIDSAAARERINVAAADVERVIAPSHSMSGIERLQVYASAYAARLLECLRSEFPALVHALGQEPFDAFAIEYLQRYPSSSYTLAKLSARFPQYLADTRPSANEDDWPQFLIDLATLERTYSEVFDGPGCEGQPLLSAEALARIPRERWPDVKLMPVPCLRLLALKFPVHEYASAVRRVESPEFPPPRSTWLAITRRNFVVRRTPLSQVPFNLLRALCTGAPLGEAIACAFSATDSFESATSLHEWFRDWTATGFFLGLLESDADSQGSVLGPHDGE